MHNNAISTITQKKKHKTMLNTKLCCHCTYYGDYFLFIQYRWSEARYGNGALTNYRPLLSVSHSEKSRRYFIVQVSRLKC